MTHVDERFYAALLDELGRWDREWDPVDRDTLAECEAVLFGEARMLDEARFEDWTELLTSDCVYWPPVPNEPSSVPSALNRARAD